MAGATRGFAVTPNVHRRLLQRLREHMEEVRRLTAGLDEAALSKPTVPEKWSLKELVGHLCRVQQVFEQRIVAMLTEDNPAVTIYDPDQDPEFQQLLRRAAKDLIVALQSNRETFLAQLEILDTAEWHRRGRHPQYPDYDVHFQVDYMVHHEAHHLYQMYERRVALGALPPCPEVKPASAAG
jgi:hypothetical protein